MFLTIFQLLTRLLTSKHLKLFSTFLVGRIGTMWKTCFQLLKMRTKKISWDIKSKCLTDFLLKVRFSSMKDHTFHYMVITWKKNVYINLKKKQWKFENFCLQVTGYLNTRKSFPICVFVVMASGKCDLHIHLTFLQVF